MLSTIYHTVLLRSIILITPALLLASCLTPPEFPLEPEIEYNNVSFIQGAPPYDVDSLRIEINFRDGDGDLGLDKDLDEHSDIPYNSFWGFYKTDGTFLKLSDRVTSPYDTLPPYEFPYYCTNYTIFENDTFYIQKNKDHYNIFVKYWHKVNGVFKEYDWVTGDNFCGDTMDGRFPMLSKSSSASPLQGTLSYNMVSSGFEFIFRLDTLKLEVTIQDRALNKSNTIETPEFTLQSILK